MSITFAGSNRFLKIAVLTVLGASGIALIYFTIERRLSPLIILVLTAVYLALARMLVRRFTGRSLTQEGIVPVSNSRKVPEIVKAIGCFFVAGALAWFGPKFLPDTVVGAMTFVVPALIFVFAGGIFVARSFAGSPK